MKKITFLTTANNAGIEVYKDLYLGWFNDWGDAYAFPLICTG
ncbi:hypothetical protein [Mucilaginibacter sp. SMC90]|nr:hypothetical protein [Mucilaginibacter sp. SMC90]